MDLVVEAERGPCVMCRFCCDVRSLTYYLRDRRPGHRIRETVYCFHLSLWSASPVDGHAVDHFATACAPVG